MGHEHQGHAKSATKRHDSEAQTPTVGKSSNSQSLPAAHAPSHGGNGLYASPGDMWSRGIRRIASPREVDFGDVEIDETRTDRIYVFNQDAEPASVSAHIEGSRALTIMSKPQLLRPSRDGFDPDAGIEVLFKPTASTVDNGVLAVTLAWRDGVSETVRITIHAAAHRRSEPTHAQQAIADADAKRSAEQQKEQAITAAAYEQTLQNAEKRPGGFQTQIDVAWKKLSNAAEYFFANQSAGVSSAAKKVDLYARRKISEQVAEPIAITLMKIGLDVATGRMSGLVEAGFAALATPTKFKQWEKGTTLNPSATTLSALKGIVGIGLAKGKAAVESHLTWTPHADELDQPAGEERVDFFSAQVKALNEAIYDRKNALVDIERTVLPLNTPELAGMAARMLELMGEAFTSKAQAALEIQEYETTRHWARFLAHASLGSINSHEAKRNDLSPMPDGSPTANTGKALNTSGPHSGLIDVEFAADLVRPMQPIKITSARLFGLSRASVRTMKLDSLPLASSGLPIRLRSSSSSNPMAVTITRDEAGNVQFVDESGAAGMQTRWLSARGGDNGGRNDAAAHRAAKQLIEGVQVQTLAQLGVSLELDDA